MVFLILADQFINYLLSPLVKRYLDHSYELFKINYSISISIEIPEQSIHILLFGEISQLVQPFFKLINFYFIITVDIKQIKQLVICETFILIGLAHYLELQLFEYLMHF